MPPATASIADNRRLAIFLSVVDEGSFTAAGDALDMFQPAVSQAIRELEEDLGTALFHRLGRAVRLTPAGEALVLPARQARHDLPIGRQAVEEVTGLRAGRLDLACLPTLAVAPLAPLVGEYRAAYPGVTIRLADPADTAESLGVRDLARLPIVAAPPGSSTRGPLDDALKRSAAGATVVVEAAQREALRPLIMAGAGAGLLPRPVAEMAETLGCVVAEPHPTVFRTVALVHREGPLTPAARRFIDLAVERRA